MSKETKWIITVFMSATLIDILIAVLVMMEDLIFNPQIIPVVGLLSFVCLSIVFFELWLCGALAEKFPRKKKKKI